MTKYYYAIRFGMFGRAYYQDGSPIGRVHRFKSRRERDTWVADGAAYEHEIGFRLAGTAKYLAPIYNQQQQAR